MALSIPLLNSCLGCISLRTGTKLFGFISLTVNLFIGLYNVFGLIHWAPKTSGDDFKDLVIYFAISLMVQSTQVITSVLLLMAAYQEKPGLIPPWLISTVITAVAEIFDFSVLVHFFLEVGSKFDSVDGIVFMIITMADDVYGFLVVHSYYQSLTPQSQGR